jgi:hypothetical protein
MDCKSVGLRRRRFEPVSYPRPPSTQGCHDVRQNAAGDGLMPSTPAAYPQVIPRTRRRFARLGSAFAHGRAGRFLDRFRFPAAPPKDSGQCINPDLLSFPTGLHLVVRPARPVNRSRKRRHTRGKTSCRTQSKSEGTFYATKRTDHPTGTARGRVGRLVEERRARPHPTSLAFRQMMRAST